MPASVAHSTGPPDATKCFNCLQIGHYKANCPRLTKPKATINTKPIVANAVPTQPDMAKLLANMLLPFFTALAGFQPATPSAQAPPLPMQSESTVALQSRIKSLENENAEQSELISQLYLRIAELTETVSALSNQLPMLSVPATVTEKKEAKIPPGLSLQTVSDAKLSNTMPTNSHTIKKEPESKQEQESDQDKDSKKKELETKNEQDPRQIKKEPTLNAISSTRPKLEKKEQWNLFSDIQYLQRIADQWKLTPNKYIIELSGICHILKDYRAILKEHTAGSQKLLDAVNAADREIIRRNDALDPVLDKMFTARSSLECCY